MRLTVDTLSQVRGERRVFTHVSFVVEAGEMVVLRGPNGAGKTTLLRTIAGLMTPVDGRVLFEGGRPDAERDEQAHFVGHAHGMKARLSVRENLEFWVAFLGTDDAKVAPDKAVVRALEALALEDLADVPAGYLSAGQKRRLGLARLVAVPRPLWLLDEPTVSLDQASVQRFAGVMRTHLAGGGLIVAATHLDLDVGAARVLDLGAPADAPFPE